MISADLSKDNRELVKFLQDYVQSSSSDPSNYAVTKLEDEVRVQKQRNAIIRNVFHALVLESGVNWAKEPSLKEFILSEPIQ